MTATPMPSTPPHVPEQWRRRAARVHFANTAAGASDYARAIVPVISVDVTDNEPGEYIQQARRMRAWALEVMTAAVLAERARGCTWQQIAAAFGYDVEFVRGRWEPVEQAWLADEPVEVDGLVLNLIEPPHSDADARKIAERLDEWCLRNRAPVTQDTEQANRPVSYCTYYYADEGDR